MLLCQQIENQNALSDHCMGDGTENLAAEKNAFKQISTCVKNMSRSYFIPKIKDCEDFLHCYIIFMTIRHLMEYLYF